MPKSGIIISVNWETDKGIYKHFSNLKEKSEFLRKVAEIRTKAGLPMRGLNKIETSDEFPEIPLDMVEAELSQESNEIIKRGVADIIKKFKLGPHLEQIVEGYIVQGDKYTKRMGGSSGIMETIGCSLDHDRASSILRIYPEATLNRVITFLKKNWDDIKFQQMHIAYAELSEDEKAEDGLENASQGRFQIKIKAKPKRYRDKGIMELHDWGILTATGTFSLKNTKAFLLGKGVTIVDSSDIATSFKSLGYDLPKPDAIKKVIQRLNKARKR